MGSSWRFWKASSVVAFCVVSIHLQCVSASISNSLEDPGSLEHLKRVIQDKELSMAESLKSQPKLRTIKDRKDVATSVQKKKSISGPEVNKGQGLRQELALESKDNCLAKLLCEYPKPVNNPTGIYRDYASLIKGFFDIFSDDSPPKYKFNNKNKKKKEEEKEEESAEDDNARSGEKFVNITTSIGSESEEVTTSATSTISSTTTGATITELPTSTFGLENSQSHSVTLEEFVGDAKLTRQSRGIKMPIDISFGNVKQTKYINRKIRQMRFAKSEAAKLRIAGKIAKKLRQPKQCREFSNVASEILTTCPLTSEVIRYFNTNLNNGSQQVAILKQTPQETQGGLVVLNDQGGIPHPYFMDNSPIVANTKIMTDLKNPSVVDRFPSGEIQHPIYENAVVQKFNTKIVSLSNQNEGKKKKESNEEDDSDEEEDEEEEDDEEDNNEYEDDIEDNGRIDINIRTGPFRSRNKFKKVKISDKKEPKPTVLPKGIIKVYGVSQPSFGNEFSKISSQIGKGPVVSIDQDDFDAPNPNYPVRRQPVKNRIVSNKQKPSKPIPESSEEEEEEEEEEEDDERVFRRHNNKQKPQPRQQQRTQRPTQARRRPFNFGRNQVYGAYPSHPAPRLEEYYQNGKPLRKPPPTPYTMPMNYNPRKDKIRGRLNFVHAPGAALMRPPHNRPQGPHGFRQFNGPLY